MAASGHIAQHLELAPAPLADQTGTMKPTHCLVHLAQDSTITLFRRHHILQSHLQLWARLK